MANAKKCDRCGEYYSANTYYKTAYGRAVTGISTGFNENDNVEWYDLCDSCIKKLYGFLETKEVKMKKIIVMTQEEIENLINGEEVIVELGENCNYCLMSEEAYEKRYECNKM